METLLADLMSEKNRLEALHHDLEKERLEVEQWNAELKNQLQQLRVEERTIIQQSRDRVVREAAELQKEIRQASAQLRKEITKKTIEQTRKALAAVQEQLRGETWQAKVGRRTEGETVYDSSIAKGDTVWLKEANLQATVLSVSEETQQVEVQAGTTKIKLGLDGVEKMVPSPGSGTPGFVPAVETRREKPVPAELHLRGKRADEVEWALDSYLDAAYLANLNEVRIVHGVGTGTIRSIVRDLLTSHPLVKSFRPGERGEGGNGVTIARL